VDQRAALDRWILSEVGRTVREVRKALEGFEAYPAARTILEFVDSLSNWYVRRSRPRFWGSDWTQDKADAYWTLYECLLDLARMSAPFVPFFSEYTWRNLAAPLPGAPESVHLAGYPEAHADRIDEKLLDDMGLVREAVTLGLSARRAENVKVRQPLALCELVAANASDVEALRTHLPIVMEELNIKAIEFSDRPEDYVEYEVKPNFKVLGPRLGKDVQAVRAALSKGDGAAFYRQLQEGALTLELSDKTIELTVDEVEVRLAAKDGYAAAQGKRLVVVLRAEITEELKHEGWVRDFVRLVQEMRKEMDLPYDARIDVAYDTSDGELSSAITNWHDFIAGEVLATSLHAQPLDGDGKAVQVDETDVRIAVSVL